jgi:DNA-binding NtrC family response regulator
MRILIVDDNVDTVRGLEALLRGDGTRIACAIDGVAALEYAALERFDVVIADVRMPRMGGLELCARVHAIDPHAPVILITGHEIDVADALRAGALDVLAKPLDFEALSLSVERALAKRGEDLERERLFAEMEDVFRLRPSIVAELKDKAALLGQIPDAVRRQAAIVRGLLGAADEEQVEEELTRLERCVLEEIGMKTARSGSA